MSPEDTGNLRHNAIVGGMWTDKNRFKITFRNSDAHYIEILQENTFAGGSKTKLNEHKGFIDKIFMELKKDFIDYFENGKNVNMRRYRKFSDKDISGSELRDVRHKRSIDLYKMVRENSKETTVWQTETKKP